MPLIALTGGIASGKSTVAARWAEHGAVVVDADQVARDVQRPGGEVLARIVERFGEGVRRADGTLDRSALASAVFADESAVDALNAIVHPAVRRRAQSLFVEAFDANPDAIVVYDVPLLVESGATTGWDLIVTVEAPAGQRIARLIENRGFAEGEARARVAAQATDDQRRAVADVIIDSSGSLAETRRQADRLWKTLSASAPDVGGGS